MTKRTVDIIDSFKSQTRPTIVNDLIDKLPITVARYWSSDFIELPEEAEDFNDLLENTIIDYDMLMVVTGIENYGIAPMVVNLVRNGVLCLDGTIHNNIAYALEQIARAKLESLK